MINFVEKPNLPRGKVCSVICGVLCREINDYLDSRGIERVCIEPNNCIDTAVKCHADMAAIHLGDDSIIVDKNQSLLIDKLKEKGCQVSSTSKEIKGEYPKDVGLNFIILDDKLIGKTDDADLKLLDSTRHLTKINVRQGYSKCSCLVVSDNAVITDDESIGRALRDCGVDVLLVAKGDVHLSGHDYGFIGGASCKLSESEILFFGDITNHKDYKKIAYFLEKYACEMISLDFPLSDFGGIIPLREEV